MPRNFVFPLQKLLRIKEYYKKVAQRELGKSLNHLLMKNEKLECLKKEKSSEQRKFDITAEDGIVDISRIISTINCLEEKSSQISECKNSILKLENEVKEKKDKLREAFKEERKLSRYRDNLLENYLKDENRKSNKEIDEIASRMHQRERG